MGSGLEGQVPAIDGASRTEQASCWKICLPPSPSFIAVELTYNNCIY